MRQRLFPFHFIFYIRYIYIQKYVCNGERQKCTCNLRLRVKNFRLITTSRLAASNLRQSKCRWTSSLTHQLVCRLQRFYCNKLFQVIIYSLRKRSENCLLASFAQPPICMLRIIAFLAKRCDGGHSSLSFFFFFFWCCYKISL